MKIVKVRTIILHVRVGEDGRPQDIDVQEGEHVADRLCWDEALGQVVSLIHPVLAVDRPRYGMYSPDDLVRRMEGTFWGGPGPAKQPKPPLQLPNHIDRFPG